MLHAHVGEKKTKGKKNLLFTFSKMSFYYYIGPTDLLTLSVYYRADILLNYPAVGGG
jgi:hypothetical protein